MAVFTPLARDDVTRLLAHHSVGELVTMESIAAGIENTNYFVDTTEGRFVLTLFERLSFQQLPFYLELMRHLAERDLPVPMPQENRSASLVSEVKGKPAALVTRLAGRWLEHPTVAHCATFGTLLAQMHLRAQDLPRFQPNLRGIGWWKTTLPQLQPYLEHDSFQFLAEEVIRQDTFFRSPTFENLPSGAAHCDLFRDNVLWHDSESTAPRIGGVIDFYFAGCTLWLFDIAIAVNDWCAESASGELDVARAKALLNSYHAVRPLLALEHDAWPTVLRAAALRFWMSRLYDWHLPRPAQVLKPHDPARFERLLRARARPETPPWID